MTTATSKFVTSFDVCVVVGTCFFGVGYGLFGLRHTHELNSKLREVKTSFNFFLLLGTFFIHFFPFQNQFNDKEPNQLLKIKFN